MDRRIPVAALAIAAALLCAGASAAQTDGAARVEAWVRTSVSEHLERHHLRADVIDVEALVAEAKRRHADSGVTSLLERWLGQELLRQTYAFAPINAEPDGAVRYALPFDPVYPRLLNQGPGGKYSHEGRSYHAYDFVLPVGTPVHAARAGVVARVVDGFTKGLPDKALMHAANRVIVLHDDGTFASYSHLDPGIPVNEGQRVERRQVIASSGNTGYAGAPHLHFEVARNEPDGPRSIPIRFGRPGSRGFVPEQGAWVGSPPRPTVELALYADDVLITPGAVVESRTGESVRIRTEVLLPAQPPRDVTQHPRLELVSMAPWILDVAGPNEIVFRPMEQFPHDWGLDLETVTVGVFFLNGKDREIGLGKVEFRLTDRQPQKTP
jgi:murein DD-endopeptidase MepM/ murein hydrolase activator NlpD